MGVEKSPFNCAIVGENRLAHSILLADSASEFEESTIMSSLSGTGTIPRMLMVLFPRSFLSMCSPKAAWESTTETSGEPGTFSPPSMRLLPARRSEEYKDTRRIRARTSTAVLTGSKGSVT